MLNSERNLIKELGFPIFCHNTQNEIEQRKQSSDFSSMNVTGSKHCDKAERALTMFMGLLDRLEGYILNNMKLREFWRRQIWIYDFGEILKWW